MVEVIKTDSTNKDFIELVKLLDTELAIRDGDDHDFYHQFNHIDSIKHVVVLYENKMALACGSIKHFNEQCMEIKRMYCKEVSRGNGYASIILQDLELWAKALNYQKCILETGINQPEAIALYKKCDYRQVENYGQYSGLETSFCFEKLL